MRPASVSATRVKHAQDEAERALATHESADRVVDFPGERSDGGAVRRRRPIVDRGEHVVPVIDQIARDDRRDDREREHRDQRLSAGPHRAHHAVRTNRPPRLASSPIDCSALPRPSPTSLLQPRPALVIGQRLELPEIDRQVVEEVGQLADDDRCGQQEQADKDRRRSTPMMTSAATSRFNPSRSSRLASGLNR